MNSGKGLSDDLVTRKHVEKHTANHSEVTIKNEIEVKEERNDNTELVESNELSGTIPTVGTRNSIEMSQLFIKYNFDCVKGTKNEEEEEEQNGKKKKSCENGNQQSNTRDRVVRHQNVASNNSNNDHRRQRLNCKVKARGRNRILTKKRNMATASKTRKVLTKPQKIHKCSQCDYVTSKKSDLIIHIRIHTGERPFECDTCAKSFTKKQNLIRHNKTHRSLFKIHCSKCRIGFEKNKDKINHETKCKGRQYECHLCKHSTLQLANLKRHMRIHHTAEKPFECSVCSKTFTTKWQIARHSRVHKKQLPFACTKCGRRFGNQNERHSHEKRCNGRQYECHICRYNCFGMDDLKRHMRPKHTGDKPSRSNRVDAKIGYILTRACKLLGNVSSEKRQKSSYVNSSKKFNSELEPEKSSKAMNNMKDDTIELMDHDQEIQGQVENVIDDEPVQDYNDRVVTCATVAPLTSVPKRSLPPPVATTNNNADMFDDNTSIGTNIEEMSKCMANIFAVLQEKATIKYEALYKQLQQVTDELVNERRATEILKQTHAAAITEMEKEKQDAFAVAAMTEAEKSQLETKCTNFINAFKKEVEAERQKRSVCAVCKESIEQKRVCSASCEKLLNAWEQQE